MRVPLSPAGRNRVRIIGGAWRGRTLRFDAGEGLRPTPDRVRETLFNWLGRDLTGLRCLDLFAGSGALGLESLSRGANGCWLVDRSLVVCKRLEANARLLGALDARVLCCDAIEFLRDARRHIGDGDSAAGRFDVVYLDPPYAADLIAVALDRLPVLLAPDARVYVESDVRMQPPEGWRRVREGRAGSVHYALIAWEGT